LETLTDDVDSNKNEILKLKGRIELLKELLNLDTIIGIFDNNKEEDI
jgi:hypothetical protein